jgi:hypothetical protein
MRLYVGLSVLDEVRNSHGTLHDEGRRVLSLLDERGRGECEERAVPCGIKIGEGGRPFFEDGRADFNISHSRDMVAVAYCAGGNGRGQAFSVGCDVQAVKIGKNIEGIARRGFHRGEVEYIFAAVNEEEMYSRFYSIWVLKESYVKLLGLSVFDMKKAPVFAGAEGFVPGVYPEGDVSRETIRKQFWLYEIGGAAKSGEFHAVSDAGISGSENLSGKYMLAITYRNTGEPIPKPEFCWFSPTLPVFHVKHFSL